MQTVDEFLEQIKQKKIKGSDSVDEFLSAIKSGEIQYDKPNEDFSNTNDLGTLTGAFGLGAANMINNTVTGGAGWLLGNLGRGVEYISPFSGRDDEKINSLLNAGYTLDEIDQIYPNEDSWVTSAAKGILEGHNAIDDAIMDWRNDLLGDNPTLAARVAEGSGSSIGFILSGLAAASLASAPGAAGLLGAATSGTLESLSETGGFLGDAYREGKYDNGAIGTANKDFLSNVGLNTGLNYTVGAFNPYIRGIVNPVNRWLASTAGETVNELLQEPSQQIIEQAASQSLNTNSDYLPNLYDSIAGNGEFEGKGWWDTAKQLAPEVALSTLLTQGLVGATGVSTQQGRNRFMHDWNRRNEPKQTATKNSDSTPNVPNVTPIAPDVNNTSGEQNTTYNTGTQQLGFNMPIDNNPQNTAQNTQQQAPRVTPQIDRESQTAPTAKSGSNTTRIRTMKGTEVDARYRVLDANDLITSTTERGGLNPNYLAELQPRDRGTSASDDQVRAIANNLDPELLGESRLASDGAPVIGSDLMVESGNGRVMAIRNAYKHGKAEHYRQWVKDNASYFGIDPAYIDSVQNPVLVRERISDVDRVNFTREANESSISAMSTTEHALDDAKKLTPDMLTAYDADKSLEDNKTFLYSFLGVVPENEQADMKQKDGKISRSGIERARNALVALAYNDAGILRRLTENYDDEVKNITDGLTAAAPKIAIFETGKYSKDLSIRDDVLKALNTLADIRSNKGSVADYLSQILMFDEDKISPEARMLLKFFDDNKRSYKRIAQGLIDYANLAMQEAQTGQGLLFEDSSHSKSELLQQVINTRVHSKEFIKWFGDWQNSPKNASKVVDKNGFPLTVYHGTESKTGKEPFSIFDMAGRGIAKDTGAWFNSNPKAAKTFGNYLYDVYLDIKHPYVYIARDRVKDTRKMDQIVRDVKAGKYGEGYDGVIFRNVEDVMHYFGNTPDELVGDVYVVFRREQIKSTSNTEFGTTNPDIHHQDKINRAGNSSLIQQITQQIIDMGHPQYGENGALAIAQLFDARIRAFAKYAGINPEEYIKSKNFKIAYDEDSSGINSDKRGRSEFIPARYDSDGNIINEAQTIIRVFKEADRSTILHELGHVFLKDLRDAFAEGNLKGVAKQDWTTLTKWLGVSDIDFSKGLTEEQRQRWADAHEKFATGFEKYLMTGKAPTAKLQRAFEAFKRWLTNIYQSVRNITYTGSDGLQHSFNLSYEVKQVMDRMLDDTRHSDNQNDDNAKEYFRKTQEEQQKKQTGETYNQILGVEGAEALDDKEKTTNRMDNLEVAKKMTEAGKDTKTIWQATGWERGKEGKWRYEIPDGRLTEKFTQIKEIVEHYNALKGTQKEQEMPLDQIKKILGNATLPDIIDTPALFKAYPELQKMNVRLENIQGNAMAYYSPQSKSITLDVAKINKSRLDPRSILVHEIQHAVQDIEGFAQGGNMKVGDNIRRKADTYALYRAMSDQHKQHPEISDNQQLVERAIKDLQELALPVPNEQIISDAISLYNNGENVDSEIIKSYESAYITRYKVDNEYNPNDRETYSKLAGEIEAKNTETRLNATEALRKRTPPSQTEKIERRQQIVVQKDKNGVESYAQQKQDIFFLKTKNDSLQISVVDRGSKMAGKPSFNYLLDILRENPSIPHQEAINLAKEKIQQEIDEVNREIGEDENLRKQARRYLSGLHESLDILNSPGIEIKILSREQNNQNNVSDSTNAPAIKEDDGLSEWENKSDSEIDKEYFDAIEKGDMGTARKIVEAQAKKKGYSPINFRMSHHAPIASTVDSNFGSNMENVMDSSFLPKDYWTHPDYYLYSPEERYAYSAIKAAVHDFKKGKKSGITVYRAVPKGVKDSKFSNGDWVSPSRDYAVQHGKSSLNGNYRIIEQTVPLQHLWWDGNSILEWGYDDEGHYAYKNTKNNKKLFDTVVRDDNGNIVPPSKRFSDRKSEIYYQRLPPRTRLKSWLKNMLRSKPRITLNSTEAQSDKKISESANPYSFLNPETERRYKESEKGVQPKNIGGRIMQAARNLAHSFRGDFSDLANDDSLLYAREQFRNLQRAKSRQVQEAMKSFTENLKALSPLQRDIFARKRMLDDLNWRSKNTPDAELPFGFDRESLKREFDRFTKIASRNKQVMQAIQAEEKTMQAISQEFVKLAEQLGLKLDKVFRNPHYYRHTILEYANAALTHGSGRNSSRTGNNSTLQGLVDEKLNGILNRSYMKRYRGSAKDINANYIQANGEVRAQMLMDIEVMKTLLDIKKKYDIAPRLRDKLKQIFNQGQQSGNEAYSQDTDTQTLSDIIPEGYTIWNPAGSRLIQSANSVSENVIAMALDDAAEASGVPIDKLLNSLGDTGEEFFNQLCVIPQGIADTLQKMSKRRDRGILGSAARTLTQWWKKAVLFTPTRNLKYNFRNFTGDLDALIAGNPGALKFAGQAFKDLLSHYRGKGSSQNLQDYMNRSGGLNVESMQFSDKEIQDLQNLAEDLNKSENLSMPKKAWNLIKKFFNSEVTFTQAREHWLRYAAYLAYLKDMQNNNGTPSTWGASIQDEVMAVDDIRDRAFKMSNELLGAYDQVSEAGQQLREMLIPFYSWMEVNMRRYYRLFKNGLSGKNNSDFIKRFLLGKTAKVPFYALSAADTFAKISLLTMAVQMINRFLFPDDDDELTPDVKYRPHITLGKVGGKVFYFDRIGALADAADWFALDSIFLDARDLANGQQTLGGYMKKVMTAPVSKVINGLNPMLKMPFEIATGRSLYPDINNPRTIRDTGKYLAQSFALTYPYKLITGESHSTADEFSNMLFYSSDPDEAAYFYSLDRVRQYQERVLDKKFDGFATSKRGRVLQRLKTALRYNDKKTVRECLKEYARLDGSKQGLKQSMKAMDPLHGLSKEEKKKFIRWLSDEDKKYLSKANRYFHALADRFIK